jgi:tetratricopeptide (TPR) repeat protein
MFARRGLASRTSIDRTTHAMLLRQLYLALFESRRFEQAHEVAVQALSLDVLPDVLNQDAARAALASGDVERALAHLRAAARKAPASRRPFHLWTLGSTLFLSRRYDEAAAALARAARWGTHDKPLYRGHLALALLASGRAVASIEDIIAALEDSACGQGYGRFVLGQLAYAIGDHQGARRYLEAFVRRTSQARATLGIALEGELKLARETLARMAAN